MPNTPPAGTPGAGRRVEDVLARIKGVKHNVGPEPRTYYLAEQSDLDALIAAVRAEERAKAELNYEKGYAAGKLYAHADVMIRTRAATLAEVRKVVEGLRVDGYPDGAIVADVLAALDALASEGK